MTIKQKMQGLKNLLQGIKIEELPAIDGVSAERKYCGTTLTVVTKAKVSSQNDYWLVDKENDHQFVYGDKSKTEFDTKLSDHNSFGNSDYYFSNGRNIIGKNRHRGIEEISASELEEFMPLVEDLEARTGHLLVKYAIRRRK